MPATRDYQILNPTLSGQHAELPFLNQIPHPLLKCITQYLRYLGPALAIVLMSLFFPHCARSYENKVILSTVGEIVTKIVEWANIGTERTFEINVLLRYIVGCYQILGNFPNLNAWEYVCLGFKENILKMLCSPPPDVS